MYDILIYDGVEPIDLGATFGVLSMARRIAPDLAWAGIARSAGPVACANGLQVTTDYGYDDAPDINELVVTGGPGWHAATASKSRMKQPE